MPRHGDRDTDCKVYVGDLPRDITEQDLRSSFSYYGGVSSVWVARNPPGFAFVEFEDARDADDAVRGLDGTTIGGSRVKVEHSTGKIRPKPWLRGGRGGGGGGGGGGGRGPRRPVNPNDKCYECGERGHYSYDCRNKRSGGGGGGAYGGGGSYGGSRSRQRSRSRSRSYDRDRSYSRSRSSSRNRSRSRSRD